MVLPSVLMIPMIVITSMIPSVIVGRHYGIDAGVRYEHRAQVRTMQQEYSQNGCTTLPTDPCTLELVLIGKTKALEAFQTCQKKQALCKELKEKIDGLPEYVKYVQEMDDIHKTTKKD